MALPKINSIVTDKHGAMRKVLEAFPRMVALSWRNDHERMGGWYTEKDLREYGHTWDEPVWEPKYDEQYFFVADTGSVGWSSWDDTSYSKAVRDFLGTYPTKAEAEKALAEIKRKLGKV